jgi:integrase
MGSKRGHKGGTRRVGTRGGSVSVVQTLSYRREEAEENSACTKQWLREVCSSYTDQHHHPQQQRRGLRGIREVEEDEPRRETSGSAKKNKKELRADKDDRRLSKLSKFFKRNGCITTKNFQKFSHFFQEDPDQKKVWQAVTEQQRKRHVWWLERLPKGARSEEVIDLVEKCRRDRNWKAPTVMNAMNTISGAVQRAEYYGYRKFHFMRDTRWTDYRRALQKEVSSRYGEVKQARPLEKNHLKQVVKKLHRDEQEVAIALALTWACVARPGDVLKLRRGHVQVNRKGEVTCRFVEGKGVTLRRRPYTVHSRVPKKWAKWVLGFIANKTEFLFQDTPRLRRKLARSLRDCDQDYDLRSIRRGAAITMAQKGVDIETIRHFTGHANVEMTERYLAWGWHDQKRACQDRRAARLLW